MKNKPITKDQIDQLPIGFTPTEFSPGRKRKIQMARQLKLGRRRFVKY